MLTGYEIDQINRAKEEHKGQVVMLNKPLELGAMISEDDVFLQNVDQDLIGANHFYDKASVIGLTTTVALNEKTILSAAFFSTKTFYTPSENHGITTLKLNAEEALCWQLKAGESVELIYIDLNYKGLNLGEVTIKSIFNENLGKIESPSNTTYDQAYVSLNPMYVVIEAKTEVVKQIIEVRGNGRFEMIKVK